MVSIQTLLNTFADMKRPVADYDEYGGAKYTLVQFSGGTPCRISSGVPSEVLNGPNEYAQATTLIYVMPDLDYQRDDEVHHGSTVYKVLGVQAPSVPDNHLKLICEVKTLGV